MLEILGDTTNSRFMVDHGAMYTPMVMEGQYWRLFSSMFLHFGFEHLAYNMFSLFFLGDILESIVGPVRYLIIYLIGGLGGNLVSFYMSIQSESYKISAGASGAIFAVMGAFFYIALRNRKGFGKDGMRRLGLMVGIEIDGDAHDTAAKCVANGLLIITAKNLLRMLPPLTITTDELDEAVAILEKTLKENV